MFGDLLARVTRTLAEQAAQPLKDGLPLDRVLHTVAQTVLREWTLTTDFRQRRAQLEALARAEEADVRSRVRQLVAELAPPELHRPLVGYVEYVPEAVRRWFSRQGDPTGHTAPARLRLNKYT